MTSSCDFQCIENDKLIEWYNDNSPKLGTNLCINMMTSLLFDIPLLIFKGNLDNIYMDATIVNESFNMKPKNGIKDSFLNKFLSFYSKSQQNHFRKIDIHHSAVDWKYGPSQKKRGTHFFILSEAVTEYLYEQKWTAAESCIQNQKKPKENKNILNRLALWVHFQDRLASSSAFVNPLEIIDKYLDYNDNNDKEEDEEIADCTSLVMSTSHTYSKKSGKLSKYDNLENVFIAIPENEKDQNIPFNFPQVRKKEKKPQ